MTFHGLFWRELSSLAPQAETIAKPTNNKIYIRVIYDYKWRSLWASSIEQSNKNIVQSAPQRMLFQLFLPSRELKTLYCISKKCTSFSLFLDETWTCQKLVFISKKFSWLCLTELPCTLRHKCLWIGKFVILKVPSHQIRSAYKWYGWIARDMYIDRGW